MRRLLAACALADERQVSLPEPAPAATDDWAPLPPIAPLQHPGEQVELAPSQAVALQQQQRAEQAAAAAALANLQARLAAARPASSWLAAAQGRSSEAADTARRQLAQAVGGSPAVLVPGAAKAAAAPGPDPFADPREQEPWFLGLPAAEQQRLRQHWLAKQELLSAQPAWQRRLQWQRLSAALVVFASLLVLGTGAVWIATLGAGVVCGLCWRHLSADRYRDPVVAVALLFAGHLVAMVGSGAEQLPPGLFLDVLLLTGMAALVGFAGEIRRSGGFDVS